jgi:hypothetical protein
MNSKDLKKESFPSLFALKLPNFHKSATIKFAFSQITTQNKTKDMIEIKTCGNHRYFTNRTSWAADRSAMPKKKKASVALNACILVSSRTFLTVLSSCDFSAVAFALLRFFFDWFLHREASELMSNEKI